MSKQDAIRVAQELSTSLDFVFTVVLTGFGFEVQTDENLNSENIICSFFAGEQVI